MAVSVTLAQSPVVQRLEHGIYGLRGRRYAASALGDARAQLATKLTGAVTEGANSFRLRISHAVLINEQHNIPAQLRAAALGKPVLVEGAPSSARVGTSGVIRRLNRCFPGLAPGDELEVTVDGESLNVTRCNRYGSG